MDADNRMSTQKKGLEKENKLKERMKIYNIVSQNKSEECSIILPGAEGSK